MDIINTLSKELDGKHLTEIEKLRYIYLKCCYLFFFDARWSYSDIFKDNVKKEILDRKIDLTNEESFSVVCHNFSSEVLKPLVEDLVGLDCHVEGLIEHSYLEVEDSDGLLWNLDGISSDTSRLKLGMRPLGMTGGYSDDYTEMNSIDNKLGFKFKSKSKYQEELEGISLKEKFNKINELLSKTDASLHFADANYFLRMMLTFCEHSAKTYTDKDYNFHKLIDIPMNKEDYDMFYDLRKEDGKYQLKEIDEEEYCTLVKRLKCK